MSDTIENVIFSSCGNDSVALIQFALDVNLPGLHVAYSQTGWGSAEWPDRVAAVAAFCERNGAGFHEIPSEGFSNLCKSTGRQAFPRDGMQFCTEELKIKPAIAWLSEIDPKVESGVLIGIRREESRRRADFPEHTPDSERHGGRDLWAPLVRHTKAMRDELIIKTGLPILDHRSRECFPCVNSNKMDLRDMTQADVDKVALLEKEMGVGKRSGKAKYMFRATAHGGAEGIVEVIKWASHSKYIEGQDDMFGGGCDSGFCGD